mmetsp:Transcript_86356/g.180726  ORF Transcript_86356/g.180726 Transcript_86356/m.180726 type:complete len:207 (+) Transcript_86356:283-903(+)
MAGCPIDSRIEYAIPANLGLCLVTLPGKRGRNLEVYRQKARDHLYRERREMKAAEDLDNQGIAESLDITLEELQELKQRFPNAAEEDLEEPAKEIKARPGRIAPNWDESSSTSDDKSSEDEQDEEKNNSNNSNSSGLIGRTVPGSVARITANPPPPPRQPTAEELRREERLRDLRPRRRPGEVMQQQQQQQQQQQRGRRRTRRGGA